MANAPAGGAARPQALRADARDNRDRILEAARDAFAALGLEVTMREIARRAGVGVATLYRRFPTKESLVTEVFAEQVAACVAAVDDALADPDPWRGFCMVVQKACTMQALDRGFTAAFLSALPQTADFGRERDHNARGFAELTRRARESGQLRADFAHDDLRLLIMANGGIAADSPDAALAASRRLVALLLQSLRAHPADPPDPLPPGPHHEANSAAAPAAGPRS
jgi:AcrR family transcriptional regulator